MHEACERGDVEGLKALLDQGMITEIHNRDNDFITPLWYAMEKKNLEIVDMILSECEKNKIDIINEKVCWRSYTYVHLASVIGNVAMMELFVRKGADVNVSSDFDFVPFHNACLNGNLKMVKYLVSAGANIHALTDDGRSGFNLACQYKNKEVVEYLGSVMLLN